VPLSTITRPLQTHTGVTVHSFNWTVRARCNYDLVTYPTD